MKADLGKSFFFQLCETYFGVFDIHVYFVMNVGTLIIKARACVNVKCKMFICSFL